jgi:hypothetical protein
MWLGRQFSWSQVLESEVESKSSWTWTPPWCGCPSSSSLTPWPSPSPCCSSLLFLINNTCMEPRVSSEKQLIRLERTWRSNYRARALVIGPCIVCKGEMSSSSRLRTLHKNPMSGDSGKISKSSGHFCMFTLKLSQVLCECKGVSHRFVRSSWAPYSTQSEYISCPSW